MNNEPAPCPICGGECKDEKPYLNTASCLSCAYLVRANTKEQAIALHNRLAGVCRLTHKHHSENTGLDTWERSCDNEIFQVGEYEDLPNYCPKCGRKVEEAVE